VKATADGFEASVTIKNEGTVAGKEVVQVYVHAPEGGLEKPDQELKAFAKTKLLAPGESQTLTFQVDAYSLASFNEAASAWEAAAGVYTVNFGASIQDLRRSGSFKLKKAQSWPVHNVLAPVSE
jgi:beta-glucosidase